MANKKISQLNPVDPSVGIGTESVFPMVSGTSSSNYQTSKVTSVDIAKFVLNPIQVCQAGLESIGFTGAANVYFDKSYWVDTSNAGTHAFVMVDKTNGQLTTGSGIGVVAGGDNMGDCKATQNVNMQNNSIINIASLFFNQTASTVLDEDGTNLSVQAGTDLTLSGIRHVHISGQALDLASTPISGDVTITGGNLEIDPGNKLIVNELEIVRGTSSVDSGVLTINGASRNLVTDIDGSEWVFWGDSNIQYDTVNTATPNFAFEECDPGQTLTMYIENTHTSNYSTPTFTSGTPNKVLWGGTGGPPHIAPEKTNVYTFVRIGTGIFASAITGYAY